VTGDGIDLQQFPLDLAAPEQMAVKVMDVRGIRSAHGF